MCIIKSCNYKASKLKNTLCYKHYNEQRTLPVCNISYCKNISRSIKSGICSSCYDRKLRGVDVETEGPINRQFIKYCVLKGCNRKHDSKGYCATHASRLRKYGDPHFTMHGTDYLILTEEQIKEEKAKKRRKREKILHQKRMKTDKVYKTKVRMRSRFNKTMNKKHRGKYLEWLGISWEEFNTYLESKFYSHPKTSDVRYPEEGHKMTMENRGFGFAKWHIDHIKPIACFDLEDEEQARECWHYTNLQPLWQYDNLRKGAKINT